MKMQNTHTSVHYKGNLLKKYLINLNLVRYFKSTPNYRSNSDDELLKKMDNLLKNHEAKREKTNQILESIKQDQAKGYLNATQERIDKLMEKQDIIQTKLEKRITEASKNLDDEDLKKIDKHQENLDKLYEKTDKKSLDIEKEFADSKCAAYFDKKVDHEASSFKKIIHEMEKEEKIIHDIIKEKSQPGSELDKYINDRGKLNEEHAKSIQECREEKKSIKEVINSNIQKPSEIAQELVDETGPDYTGGDD